MEEDSQPKAAYSSKSRARMLQERREAAKKKNAITLGASGVGSPARGGVCVFVAALHTG
jgi:hypothetical protein